jgi:hypothetical protein
MPCMKSLIRCEIFYTTLIRHASIAWSIHWSFLFVRGSIYVMLNLSSGQHCGCIIHSSEYPEKLISRRIATLFSFMYMYVYTV